MFNIPAIGTEQGVESTLRGMMEDKSYGHLKVDHGSPDPRPPGGEAGSSIDSAAAHRNCRPHTSEAQPLLSDRPVSREPRRGSKDVGVVNLGVGVSQKAAGRAADSAQSVAQRSSPSSRLSDRETVLWPWDQSGTSSF